MLNWTALRSPHKNGRYLINDKRFLVGTFSFKLKHTKMITGDEVLLDLQRAFIYSFGYFITLLSSGMMKLKS